MSDEFTDSAGRGPYLSDPAPVDRTAPRIDSFTGEYGFLSNFYPVEVRFPDYKSQMTMNYPSVEHGYQAAKTIDPNHRDWVRSAETASEAKRRGQKVTMRSGWNATMRVSVMAGLLRQKFRLEPLRSQLLATGDAELIEGNTWHDQFWGDCRCPQHIGMGGLNWLGELLMKVRRELRSESSAGPRPTQDATSSSGSAT